MKTATRHTYLFAKLALGLVAAALLAWLVLVERFVVKKPLAAGKTMHQVITQVAQQITKEAA